jgi:D-alanyl-D-alanine carboxypeptidase (penicillin-binding protein 5/6)
MTKSWRAILVVAALVPAAAHAQPDVTARGAIIVDAETGASVWELNADEALPPASTTKVMTAVLALQSHQLDQEFMVSAHAAATPPSKIGLKAGQSVALRDLLYAVLLKSANDAAVVVAEGVAGSEAEFADRMNLKARVVGATTTNFVNPHGLTEYGHVTTARDLSRIFRYGLGVPGFREVLSTTSAEVFIDGPGARMATVRSHNRLLNAPDYRVIGKTGYTRPARRCFVGAAGYGSREVVIAILGSTDLWGDARRMLYYAMSPGRPTPVLTASASPPPPPAPELRAAPPVEAAAPAAESRPQPVMRAVPAEEPAPAPADSLDARQPALTRAARMTRGRGIVVDDAEAAEEPGPLEARPAEASPPPPASDEPARGPEPAASGTRQPTAEAAGIAPAVHREAADAAPLPPPEPASVEEGIHPAAADRRIAPAFEEPARARGQEPGGEPDDPPDEPGAAADEPAPKLWADSPVRDPDEPHRRAARERPAVAEREAPEPETSRTAGRQTGSAREARTDGRSRRAQQRAGSVAVARAAVPEPHPSRSRVRGLERDSRTRAKTAAPAKTAKETSPPKTAKTAASAKTAKTAAPAKTSKTAATKRAGKGSAGAAESDAAPTKGRYTVQLGPYPDRKAVATARADLAKRGYEARVVGQKLELGNFAERSRADKLAGRLRVTGHRATSAAVR